MECGQVRGHANTNIIIIIIIIILVFIIDIFGWSGLVDDGCSQ